MPVYAATAAAQERIKLFANILSRPEQISISCCDNTGSIEYADSSRVHYWPGQTVPVSACAAGKFLTYLCNRQIRYQSQQVPARYRQ